MWWNEAWPMPWMFFGPVMMITVVIICMTLVFVMMRGGSVRRAGRRDAIDILKERYARGEINQAEYDERRRVLQR
jgi:putative membrane protein